MEHKQAKHIMDRLMDSSIVYFMLVTIITITYSAVTADTIHWQNLMLAGVLNTLAGVAIAYAVRNKDPY